ncbi:acyl carrier protein phosphodiesterase [Nonlabens marinus]|uniref:Acyl carrier protein phosphodiesterase n=1 Tax=Nonlabens marinus S1-08 TaxID=1454201 RepID=W8VSR3_9FLAO|nr:acyl carrier protein phosphodiesterase [Nonlabens marinus]BAO56435.1 acyl carrier protein phosphodiesterase [Nonlabens marinus S1-08]
MNYLAHLLLSGNDTELRIGNFIADSVRGKNLKRFPERVAQGIMVHRMIDTFTDTHSIVRESKDLIRTNYGLWSSVIVDLYYDHFLAANWSNYHDTELEEYTLDFYADLKEYWEILPPRIQRFYPIMVEHNWIYSYRTVQGMKHILYQMNQRTKGKSNMQLAGVELIENYDALQKQFTAFFEELQTYSKNIIHQLDLD